MKNGLFLINFWTRYYHCSLFNHLETVILEFSILFREEFGIWPLTSRIMMYSHVTLSKLGIQKKSRQHFFAWNIVNAMRNKAKSQELEQ
jgi:hypothetical protein